MSHHCFMAFIIVDNPICGSFSSKSFLWLLWRFSFCLFFFFRSFILVCYEYLSFFVFYRSWGLQSLLICILMSFIFWNSHLYFSNISSVSFSLSTPHKTLITFLLDFFTMLHMRFIFFFVSPTHFLLCSLVLLFHNHLSLGLPSFLIPCI